MAASPIQLLVVALLVLMLFGAKRIPELGRGLGSGIRSFRQGLADDDPDRSPSLPNKKPQPDTEPEKLG